MKRLRKIISVVLSILMLSILGGCGKSNSTGSSDNGKKVLKVGMECAYAPFN